MANLSDRVVHALLSERLRRLYRPPTHVRAWRGRDIAPTIARLAYLRSRGFWVLKTDILRFFDSIRSVVAVSAAGALDDIVAQHLGHIFEASGHEGLGAGLMLSSDVADLVLRPVDAVLSSVPFRMRFVDDIVIASHSRGELLEARHRLGQALVQLGLQLHPEKDRLIERQDAVTVLGIRIGPTGVLSVPEDRYERMEQRLLARTHDRKSLEAWLRHYQRLGAMWDPERISALENLP